MLLDRERGVKEHLALLSNGCLNYDHTYSQSPEETNDDGFI